MFSIKQLALFLNKHFNQPFHIHTFDFESMYSNLNVDWCIQQIMDLFSLLNKNTFKVTYQQPTFLKFNENTLKP